MYDSLQYLAYVLERPAPPEAVHTNANSYDTNYDAPTQEALAAATQLDKVLFADAQQLFERQFQLLAGAGEGGSAGGGAVA